MMKSYPVLAELVDYRDGKRHFPAAPGEEPVRFVPADDDHAARLIAAKCIGVDGGVDLLAKDPAELSRVELESVALDAFRRSMAEISDDVLREGVERHRQALDADKGGDDDDHDDDLDDLGGLKVDELKAVADKEEVDLTGLTRKADILGAIRRARAAGSGE
ncbi:MAG: hypothetical protein V4618_00825 [Pseudomonadota bacterium]